jgi:hypothetical protein
MREFGALDAYEYVRWDNDSDHADPLLRMHWRLKINQQYPERWSVLLGDVLTSLRAALDHTFWAAAMLHSGQPARPQRLMFPIATKADGFARTARELSSLVAPDLWAMIESLQPFRSGDRAHTAPLAVLQWLSNVDKHRFVHIVGRTAVDFGPVILRAEPAIEIVEEWRHEGPVDEGTVVARLKLKRPADGTSLNVVPKPYGDKNKPDHDHPVDSQHHAADADRSQTGVGQTLVVVHVFLPRHNLVGFPTMSTHTGHRCPRCSGRSIGS